LLLAACLILLPLVSIAQEQASDVPAHTKKALTDLLPPGGFYGSLALEEPVRFYNESNLYEYIDGQAEGYIAYDFQALASACYSDGANSVLVDIYDMAKPVQAFGVYSTFRAPTNDFVAIGEQGFKTGEGYMFWKGRMVVTVSANYEAHAENPEDDEATAFQAAEAAARAVAAKIPEDRSGLDLLDLLPPPGKMPNSEKYFLHAVLGQGFLENGVVAEYPYTGGVARLFVCDLGAPDAAAKAYSEYLKFTTAHGKPVETDPGKSFLADVKYYGMTEVFLEKRYLAGGVGLPADAAALLDGLRARISKAAAQ